MFTISCNSFDNVVWKNADDCLFDKIKCTSVWQIPVSHFIPVAHHFISFLSSDEIKKANRFKFEKDKNSYIIRWGMLRLLLAKYLHQDAAAIVFTKGQNNKPLIFQKEKTADLYFNISHSNDLVLIAFSNQEIGIDIEKINSEFNYKEILPVVFSEEECSAINISADAVNCFYKFFTRKESLAKATAKGINNYIINIPVLDGNHSIPENNETGIKSKWQINSFNVADNYAASIACAADIEDMEFYLANETLLQY